MLIQVYYRRSQNGFRAHEWHVENYNCVTPFAISQVVTDLYVCVHICVSIK